MIITNKIKIQSEIQLENVKLNRIVSNDKKTFSNLYPEFGEL